MADELQLQGNEKILEVGGGSGYQAAVLSMVAREVISVEAQPTLAEPARKRLARLGYHNVRVDIGDGSQGWPPGAPYEAILVAAGAPSIPQPLIDQLADGGRLVIPVGSLHEQTLLRVTKCEGRVAQESLFACRFVPLRGLYGWPPDAKQQSEGE
jgi:protein-L-isoaspartate(D-aspartate) O-methyltransferase